MSRCIRKERVGSAIASLADWRVTTQSQLSAHLFPFLSLLEKGANATNFIVYEEADDFAFFDRYFRVSGDKKNPYFDPLTRKRRISTHPHSNIATARKGTFEKSWGAAQSKVVDGQTYWKLAENFADIINRKVMTRRDETKRASVLDIAAWLFRHEEFDANADSRTLERKFRITFPLNDDQYDKLFEFNEEPPENIFFQEAMTPETERALIDSLGITNTEKRSLKLPASGQDGKSELDEDDPILQEVLTLLEMQSSGIILRGCPGTGKSWYAWHIALELTNNKPEDITRIQFHSSYGYEDFVEGYRPSEEKKSGFEVVDRKFLESVRKANGTDDTIVFIIDEINRGDPSRVFGELLTYVETGWREVEFTLPYSEKKLSIPRNLVVLATMNQHDRSITQLDMAMLRRFDHIDIFPSKDRATEFLSRAGMSKGGNGNGG